MVTTRRRARRGGFSLVELLVVVAILALLVSLLVAQLGRARRQAEMTLCKTRLRNVGAGLHLYANDQDERLPVGESLDSAQPELLAALQGAYVREDENFYCPAEKRPELSCSADNLAAAVIGYYYFSCRDLPTSGEVSGFLRKAGPDWPREIRLTAPPETWVMSDRWVRSARTAHRHYSKGVNFLLADGSVDTVAQRPRERFK